MIVEKKMCVLWLSPMPSTNNTTISKRGKTCQEETGAEGGNGANRRNVNRAKEERMFPPLNSEMPVCSLLLLSVFDVNVPATAVCWKYKLFSPLIKLCIAIC